MSADSSYGHRAIDEDLIRPVQDGKAGAGSASSKSPGQAPTEGAFERAAKIGEPHGSAASEGANPFDRVRAKQASPDPFADDPFESAEGEIEPPSPTGDGPDPFAEEPSASEGESGAAVHAQAKEPRSSRVPKSAVKAMEPRGKHSTHALESEDEAGHGASAPRAARGSGANDAGAERASRARRARPKTVRAQAVEDPRAPHGHEVRVKARSERASKIQFPPPAAPAGSDEVDSASRTTDSGEVMATDRKQPIALVAAMCAGLVVVVGVGGVWYLDDRRLGEEKSAFLRQADALSPERGVRAWERLPEALQDDVEVQATLATLRTAIDRREARESATRLLEGLSRARGLGARLALCDDALKIDPGFAEAYVARARLKALSARKNAKPGASSKVAMAEALADLHAAVRAAPEEALPYCARGLLFLMLFDRQAAITDFEKADALGKRAPVASLARGHLALLRGDLEEAKLQLNRARRKVRAPELKVAAQVALAEVFLLLGEAQEAWDAAVEARKLDAGIADTHRLLAEARMQLGGDVPATLSSLKRAVALDAYNARALALYASLLLERGPTGALRADEANLDRARAMAKRALLADGQEPLALQVLAELALNGSNLSEASALVRRARERVRGADRASLLLLDARLRVAQSGFVDPEALAELEEVLKLDPDQALALALRARAHAARGEGQRALDDLNRALALAPPLVEAYALRARLNLERKPTPLKQVIADLTRTLELDPGRTGLYFPRAQAYFRAGREREALRDLLEAEADGVTVAHAIALLRGHCRYAVGDWRRARAAYRAYLEARPGAPDREDVAGRIAKCDAHLSGANTDF